MILFAHLLICQAQTPILSFSPLTKVTPRSGLPRLPSFISQLILILLRYVRHFLDPAEPVTAGTGRGAGRERRRMGTLSVRGDVLVVPPFECAWLKLDKPGEGCFTFLAKAENDVTLIFSSNAEGKRVCGTRRNSEFYTVIIGSHVNSRLVLERSGKIVHEVAGVRASPTKFTQVSLSSATQNPHAPPSFCRRQRLLTRNSPCRCQYWVDYQTGRVSVGVGAKPGFNCLSQWQDPEPYMSIACLGLSAWDKHVCYSGLRLMGRLCFAPQSRRGSEEWQVSLLLLARCPSPSRF